MTAHSRLNRFLFFLCIVTLVLGTPSPAAGLQDTARAAPSTDVWRIPLSGEFKRMGLTPLGSLLVETKGGGLTAVDPTSGRILWNRADLADYAILEQTNLAVVHAANRNVVIDLIDGTDRWHFDRLPIREPKGYLYLPAHGLLLVYGPTPESGATVLGVAIDSGAVRWRQDKLFDRLGDKVNKVVFSRHMPPLADTDSTAVVDADEGGLVRLRLTDGQLLWSVPDSVLNLDKLEAPLQPAGGYLLAAYSKKLMAIDGASGSPKWSRSDKFPGPIYQIVPTARGVVVGGAWMHSGMTKQPRVWLDLLDPATGESLWPKAPQIHGASPFFVRGDTVFQPVNKGLRAFDLAARSQALEVTLPDFGGGEEAAKIEPQEGGDLLLISSQNLMRVSSTGEVRYQRYLKAPGASLLAKISAVAFTVAAGALSYSATPPGGVYYVPTGVAETALTARYRATVNAERYAYIFTSEAIDTTSHGGFNLARIDKSDGRVTGFIRLFDRTPDYVLDRVSGTVVVSTGRELFARRY